MTARWLRVYCIAFSLGSFHCSYLKTGEEYGRLGRHELAAHYYATALRANRDDTEARQHLIESVQAALAAIDAEYEQDRTEGRAREALGAALRREELLTTVRALGVAEFDTADPALLSRPAHDAALRSAIAQVDDDETQSASANVLFRDLRFAMAFDPYSNELAARYERLRLRLQKFVALDPECESQPDCRAFAHRIIQGITQAKRELLVLVPWSSDTKTAALRVEFFDTTNDSGWNQVDEGEHEAEIEELNRFREPERDSDGNKKHKTVRARYAIFRRDTSATVRGNVSVIDLGPSAAPLASAQDQITQTDATEYLTFEGDERALGSLSSMSTNQSPPVAPEILSRQAANILAAELARRILSGLEPQS